MAQKTPATIATKDAIDAKRPVIKPLTAAKSNMTIMIISITFMVYNLCKSTVYFIKLKMHIVSLHFNIQNDKREYFKRKMESFSKQTI